MSLFMFVHVIYWRYTSLVFFFNDTPTPKIDTYLHTLSLHDALPISPRPSRDSSGGCGRRSPASPRNCGWCSTRSARPARGCRRSSPRSEEHTSELQSLMRISYAVFCLKKKTHKHKNGYSPPSDPTGCMLKQTHLIMMTTTHS